VTTDATDPAHRVVRGGTFLGAEEHCRRHRPAARRPQAVDNGMGHLGFRGVVTTAAGAS
jgi:formylglycine-generating enzyme required for sulfatase activity